MRYTTLGPSSLLVRGLIASIKQHQQQQAGGSKVLATAPWLKTGIQVAQSDWAPMAHHPKQVLLHFKRSSAFYGQFSVEKRPFWGSFQDDRPENSGPSLFYRGGVSNEGCCSSMAIGPSKECKWVGNRACAMPWCHGVRDLEVKTSRFGAIFQDGHADRGGTSAKQAGSAPQCFPMR